MELSEYDINCKPHPTLKGQVVVDFIIDFIEGIQEDHKVNEGQCLIQRLKVWSLYVDKASSEQGSGIRMRLEAPFGYIDKSMTLGFEASNNEVE